MTPYFCGISSGKIYDAKWALNFRRIALLGVSDSKKSICVNFFIREVAVLSLVCMISMTLPLGTSPTINSSLKSNSLYLGRGFVLKRPSLDKRT